jgi:hypothetical protein
LAFIKRLFTESTLFFLVFTGSTLFFYFLPDPPCFKKESLEVSIIVLIRI